MRLLLYLITGLLSGLTVVGPVRAQAVFEAPRAPANSLLHHYDAEPTTSWRLVDGWEQPLVELPFYAVQEVSRLRPSVKRWFQGRCGDRRQERVTRYQHKGQLALFDGRGRRLTEYVFSELGAVGPNCLVYSTRAAQAAAEDDYVATANAGLPRRWKLEVDQDLRRYGLLDRAGRPRTEPRYTRLLQVGMNAVWAAAVEHNTLVYGLLDTLGRVVLPFAPGPLSLPDSAGLLRRRSAAPTTREDSYIFDEVATYPDTATVQYVYPDGRPAFGKGRFRAAGSFRCGQAVVRTAAGYGLIDTTGRWLGALTAAEAWKRFGQNPFDDDPTDPLRLFEVVDRPNLRPRAQD